MAKHPRPKMSLKDVAKELRAMSSLVLDLANEIDSVVKSVDFEALRAIMCGVDPLLVKYSAQKPPKPDVATISGIHNSMSSGGVPRKTKRVLTPAEKSLILDEYLKRAPHLDMRSPGAKQIRCAMAKEFHCSSRQVASLVTVSLDVMRARFKSQEQA